MTEILEPTMTTPPTPTRGRPPRAVKCVETGQVFGTCDLAAEWLASMAASVSAGSVRNAVGDGGTAGGFHWRWDGKTGPLKGTKYRPRGTPGVAPPAPAPPVTCVPRTPVVDSEGRAYRDAEVAAQVLRDGGFADVTGRRIVQAIADGVRCAGLYWDWKGRAMGWCGRELDTGIVCEGCRAEMEAELAVMRAVPAATETAGA